MGTELRSLRLAISAAAGYSAQFAGTGLSDLEKKQKVYDSITVGVARINEAFESEIGIHLELLPFNQDIIFLDASTQPFTEANHSTDGAANNTLLNRVIGIANYDIGHVVSKKGGGQGTMNALTYPSSKGKGSSGSPDAIGDKFWIELVAHEIGHQLAANHSFDGNQSMCGGEAEPGYNTEVGSGSSIMSYAATCGADDIQKFSDAYFTPFSYEEIRRELEGAPSVGTRVPTGNAVPQINVAKSFVEIPPQTPFTLAASGSDTDVTDKLTYSWDQIDTTSTSKALTDEPKLAGALFRPLLPSPTGQSRTFPTMAKILNGISNQNSGSCTGVSSFASDLLACRVEFLPTTERTMKFRATIRDGVGGRSSADTTVQVRGSSPFTITSHNTKTVWRSGSPQTISWNTANSENWPSPFAQVDISYSIDRGTSWVSLASGVANDGSHEIVAPAISTSTLRVRVQPVDGVFFDINDAYLTVAQTNAAIPTAPVDVAASYKANTAGAVTISWLAPLESGSSEITRYDVYSLQDPSKTCSTLAVAPAAPSLSCTISNLSVGTSYTFQATAQNSFGTSEWSSPTEPITAAATPSAPIITSVQQTSSGAIKVQFALGAENGSKITDIKIGHWTATSSNYISRSTISNSGQTSFIYSTGLTVGVAYKFTVWAQNAVGLSLASAHSSLIKSGKAPNAPTGVTGVGGDSSAAVTWIEPSANGSEITSYQVSSSPGGHTCVTLSNNCQVNGLTNGNAYTFSVVAINSLGASSASAASAAVTPSAGETLAAQYPQIASQPANYSKTVGQTVNFVVEASVSDGGSLSFQWSKNSEPISGATNANYTFTTSSTSDSGVYSVTVTNTVGASSSSTSSIGATLVVSNIPHVVTPPSALDARLKTVFDHRVEATGAGLSYLIGAGSLPNGLTLNPASGLISGVPTSAGSFLVVVAVTDSNGVSATSEPFLISVAKATQTPLSVTYEYVSNARTVKLSTTGGSGTGSVAYTLIGGSASGCNATGELIKAETSGTCLVQAAKESDETFLSVESAILTISFSADGLVPTFGEPVAIEGGFRVFVTNFDSEFSWDFSAEGATVTKGSVSGAKLSLTVSGLAFGKSSVLRVTTNRAGYTSGSSTVTGSSLKQGGLLQLSPITPIAGGFTLKILNYDAAAEYQLKVSSGKVLKGISDPAVLTVSGLTGGAKATVTITVLRTGYTANVATIMGAALKAPLVPYITSVVAGSKKLVVTVNNYDAAFKWTVKSSAGRVALTSISGAKATYTVSQLASGKAVTIRIQTSRNGYVSALTTKSGKPK